MSSGEESFEEVPLGGEGTTGTSQEPATPQDPITARAAGIREVRQRLAAIQGAQQEETADPTRRLEVDPQEEQKEDSDSQSEQVQGGSNNGTGTVIMSSTTPANVPTVHKNAGDMFKTADPRDEALLSRGICENTRAERIKADAKELSKIKKRATEPIKYKFSLPNYLVTGKYGEDDDEKSPGASGEAYDAIISTSHRCEAMHTRTKDFDLENACLVPKIKDKNGPTPADRWDFDDTAIGIRPRFKFDCG